MTIKEIELLHGVALIKIMRNKRPVNLQMMETKEESSAIYILNEGTELFIKRSKTPRPDGKTWTFSFSLQLLQLLSKSQKDHEFMAFALVCGREKISNKDGEEMFLCFLSPEKLPKVINLNNVIRSKTITVKYERLNKKGHLIVSCDGETTVTLNAINSWKVPYS